MKFYTLIVIDMQPDFSAAKYEYVINGVLREIEKAKKLNYPIMLVRFYDCGSVLPKIVKAVKGYHDLHRVIKKWDDGSDAISQKLNDDRGFGLGYRDWFRVCGVNTDQCVQATVYGMQKIYRRAKFEIVSDACGTDSTFLSKQSNYVLSAFNNAKNIKIHNLPQLSKLERKYPNEPLLRPKLLLF